MHRLGGSGATHNPAGNDRRRALANSLQLATITVIMAVSTLLGLSVANAGWNEGTSGHGGGEISQGCHRRLLCAALLLAWFFLVSGLGFIFLLLND